MKCILLLFALVLVQAKGKVTAETGFQTDPQDGGKAQELAQEILRAASVSAGLVVHLGVCESKLTAALGSAEKLLLHGIALDDLTLERTRQLVRSCGLAGRVSVMRAPLYPLPYADNLANLIVVEDLPLLLSQGLSLEEIMRVLAPLGVFCAGKASDTGRLVEQLGQVAVLDKEITHDSLRWAILRKRWPPGMDEWPCFEHGPDGNPVSQDRHIGPATRLRWRHQAWGKHTADAVSGHVTAGGRVFYCRRMRTEDGYSERFVLEGRDAFNGLLLRQKPVKGPLGEKYGDWNIVATAERLFVPLDPKGPLLALDARTGGEVRSYREFGHPSYVVFRDHVLYLAGGNGVHALEAESGAATGMMQAEAVPRRLECHSKWTFSGRRLPGQRSLPPWRQKNLWQ